MSTREDAARTVILQALRDEVAAVTDQERGNLLGAMLSLNEETGMLDVEAQLLDKRVAKVTLVKPEATVKVTNPDDYERHVAATAPELVGGSYRLAEGAMEWLLENKPELLESITEVKPGYLERLTVIQTGDGAEVVDPVTGELVPGVGVKPKAPYVTVRYAPGGRQAIADAWRAGLISLPELAAEANRELEAR